MSDELTGSIDVSPLFAPAKMYDDWYARYDDKTRSEIAGNVLAGYGGILRGIKRERDTYNSLVTEAKNIIGVGVTNYQKDWFGGSLNSVESNAIDREFARLDVLDGNRRQQHLKNLIDMNIKRTCLEMSLYYLPISVGKEKSTGKEKITLDFLQRRSDIIATKGAAGLNSYFYDILFDRYFRPIKDNHGRIVRYGMRQSDVARENGVNDMQIKRHLDIAQKYVYIPKEVFYDQF